MTDNSLKSATPIELYNGSELRETQDQRSVAHEIQKRTHKYNNDVDRHEASKANKRKWYYHNQEQQKLKSLKQYYINQLKKEDLKDDIKSKYENKLNKINEKLGLSKPINLI